MPEPTFSVDHLRDGEPCHFPFSDGDRVLLRSDLTESSILMEWSPSTRTRTLVQAADLARRMIDVHRAGSIHRGCLVQRSLGLPGGERLDPLPPMEIDILHERDGLRLGTGADYRPGDTVTLTTGFRQTQIAWNPKISWNPLLAASELADHFRHVYRVADRARLQMIRSALEI